MTRQVLISVGKRHDVDIAPAIDDFTTRVDREVETSWHLIKPSGADEVTARRLESASVLMFIKGSDFVVLLDERGKQYDSEAFAETYSTFLSQHERIVFVIGGAHGVDDNLRNRVDLVWSLSKLVFPHQIVRLILVEQLYRSLMIVKNHPYHHT